ncbi:MAG: FkbM family methyltransferase [Solirubrobacterales bacterium]
MRRLARPGMRCFDIGGHGGYYALVLARLTGGQVATFEFQQDALEKMRGNLALNDRLASQIQVVQTYVAHEQNADPPTDTLDELIADGVVFAPDFMKIDVEGAEAMVLAGATDLLTHHQPNLIIETHSSTLETECAQYLARAGYTPTVVNQRQILRERRGTEHNRWLVAIGKPAEGRGDGSLG